MSELYYANLPNPLSLKAIGPILKANLEPFLFIIRSIIRKYEEDKLTFRIAPLNDVTEDLVIRHSIKDEFLSQDEKRWVRFFKGLGTISSKFRINPLDITKEFSKIEMQGMSIKQFTQAHEAFERAVQAKKSALKSEKKRYYTILADDDQNNAVKILGELDNARSPRISVEESSTGEKKTEGEFADILVHEVIEQFNAILLETVPFKRFYIKPQLAALWKQKIALENLMYFPSDNVRQIIRLLEKPELVRWETFLPKMIGDSSWKFLTNTAYQSNEAQRDFVAKALRTPDFAFLEGPPGAGKTRAICELIYQAIKGGFKVMLVASTHVAVDNVLEGLAEMDLPIVPVRVGLEKKISPKTKDYTVGRQISSFCKKTSSYLNSEKKGRTLSTAQEDLLSIVNKSEFAMNEGELRELEELVIKSANLVCGTTIGILQYPPLKYAIEAGGVHEDEMFDYLILDEASKTTFPEFLVPAMYAKKWIIVGDPKQLTPFMESDAFTNVLSFLDKQVEALLVLCYKLKKEADRVGIIVSEDEIFDARIEQQATALGLDFFNVHKEIGHYIKLGLKDSLGQREAMRLFGARLIFGRENELRAIEKDLPPRIDYFVGNRPEDIFSFQDLVKRQEYLAYNSEFIKTSKPRSIFSQQSLNWTKEVAQKLIRFRDVDDVTFKRKDKNTSDGNEDETKGENKYVTQIKDLLPSFPVYRIHDGKEELPPAKPQKPGIVSPAPRTINERVNWMLDNLLQLWMPSVLESLTVEHDAPYIFSKRTNARENVLKNGFDPKAKTPRHVILKHQNRMEDEIARYPREMFYSNEALLTEPQISSRKKINLDHFGNRAEILDIHMHRNDWEHHYVNLDEALAILHDLDIFSKWASENEPGIVLGGDAMEYEIAIITFYANQEHLLNELVRSHFDLRGRETFKLPGSPCSVIICTVDRFQGHQADVVFTSFVRTRHVGFLDSKHRINVALTRAKYYSRIYCDCSLFERYKEETPFLHALAFNTQIGYSKSRLVDDIRNKFSNDFVASMQKYIEMEIVNKSKK